MQPLSGIPTHSSAVLGTARASSGQQGNATSPFAIQLQQATQGVATSGVSTEGMTDADRGFTIDSSLPQDLKTKLQSMWDACKNQGEREQFRGMYGLTFCPSPMKPPGYWDSNWQRTLKLTIKATEGFLGSMSPLCRANTMAIDDLLKKLLA